MAMSKIRIGVDTDCCIASCRHAGHNAVLICVHNKRRIDVQQTYRERSVWMYIDYHTPVIQQAVDKELETCVNEKPNIAGKKDLLPSEPGKI